MLHCAGLTKCYGSFTLGPLDLTVGREVVAVLGPSGCGKTTLLSLVAGTKQPDDGTVELDDAPLTARPLEARGTAYVFQDSAVFPHLTARANVAYAATEPGRVRDLAAMLEITSVLDQPAHTLSSGERRRVEVARALAADPRVLLLDEPTSGLDAPIRRRLRDQLRSVFTALDVPVLYVTHDQDEAAAVADRVAVMRDGTIHQVAPPTALFRRPATPFVASFTGNPNVFPAQGANANPSSSVVDWEGHRIHAHGHDVAPGTPVWLCIRPEHVLVGRNETDGTSVNQFEAHVDRHVFDSGGHVLTLRLADRSVAITARVLPPTLQQLDLDAQQRVPVHFPPDAIHLIARRDAAPGDTGSRPG
jgi:molybdate/tungstate transport system ATP-binding protein